MPEDGIADGASHPTVDRACRAGLRVVVGRWHVGRPDRTHHHSRPHERPPSHQRRGDVEMSGPAVSMVPSGVSLSGCTDAARCAARQLLPKATRKVEVAGFGLDPQTALRSIAIYSFQRFGALCLPSVGRSFASSTGSM